MVRPSEFSPRQMTMRLVNGRTSRDNDTARRVGLLPDGAPSDGADDLFLIRYGSRGMAPLAGGGTEGGKKKIQNKRESLKVTVILVSSQQAVTNG